ncbi:MAG: hypothetical protein EU543_02895 [Promethearchaeota archaeon]|nr:MAG: hypothetical protein EU543_02895 [Candidatus Lokiarchaeota archaeon]
MEDHNSNNNNKKEPFGINFACFFLIVVSLAFSIRMMLINLPTEYEVFNIVIELIIGGSIIIILAILILNNVPEKSK